MQNNIYDTIVIGHGPSGVSNAIYLKRFNRSVLVIGKDYGALESDSYIDNYYGIKHIKGKDLIDSGISQAKELGVEVVNDEVLEISMGLNFTVTTKNNIYEAKTIYLATGKTRTKLNVPGLKDYEGKGISYCAICDGFIYRNKKIGIIGSGDFMKKELETLSRFTKDITVFSNGEEVAVDGYEVVKDKLKSFYGENKLFGIETTENKYDLDGVFIAVGSASTLSFAKHIGLLTDEQNNIIVENYKTNIDGIYCGGNAIGGVAQVIKAASDGALAAMEINKYLRTK